LPNYWDRKRVQKKFRSEKRGQYNECKPHDPDDPKSLSHNLVWSAVEDRAGVFLSARDGDVTTLNAIAAEIKTKSDSCMPLSKQIIQMAEDFDFDGIQKLADDLDSR
jgi:hypothetical protein